MIGVKRNFNNEKRNETCGCYCFSFNRYLFCSNCACKIFYFLIEYICRSSVKRKLKILRFWAIHDMFAKSERSCGQCNRQHSFNIYNEPLGVIRTKKNRLKCKLMGAHNLQYVRCQFDIHRAIFWFIRPKSNVVNHTLVQNVDSYISNVIRRHCEICAVWCRNEYANHWIDALFSHQWIIIIGHWGTWTVNNDGLTCLSRQKSTRF